MSKILISEVLVSIINVFARRACFWNRSSLFFNFVELKKCFENRDFFDATLISLFNLAGLASCVPQTRYQETGARGLASSVTFRIYLPGAR